MRVDLQLWHNFNQTNLPTYSEVYEGANVSVLLEMKYEIYGQKNKQTNKNSQIIISWGQNLFIVCGISFHFILITLSKTVIFTAIISTTKCI